MCTGGVDQARTEDICPVIGGGLVRDSGWLRPDGVGGMVQFKLDDSKTMIGGAMPDLEGVRGIHPS